MKHIVFSWKNRNNLGQLHDFFYSENVSSMKSGLFPWTLLVFFPYLFLGLTPNAFLALYSGLLAVILLPEFTHSRVCPFSQGLLFIPERQHAFSSHSGMSWKWHDLQSIIRMLLGKLLTQGIIALECLSVSSVQQLGFVRECSWMMNLLRQILRVTYVKRSKTCW